MTNPEDIDALISESLSEQAQKILEGEPPSEELAMHTYEFSLTDCVDAIVRVAAVLRAQFSGELAIEGNGSMDFGRGMAHMANLIQNAIIGG